MKKTLIISAAVIILAVVLIAGVAFYEAVPSSPAPNSTSSSPAATSSVNKLGVKNGSYLIDGQEVALKDGSAESPAAPNSAEKISTRYFGDEAHGDLNGDGQEDSAFILTQETGGTGTFYYLAVSFVVGDIYSGLNTVLLGDRIAPQSVLINKGEITVSYADRKPDEPMSAKPSVMISRNFQVLNGKLTEILPHASLANPASVNCGKQGGTLVIQKRGDGGEYGLCNFEDNRSCEEWALMRGDCPAGGVKTTGFDTIDQKYCAWSGGQTLAVKDSVCTFKNGKKCLTIDFYNGTCSQ